MLVHMMNRPCVILIIFDIGGVLGGTALDQLFMLCYSSNNSYAL